MAGYRYAASNLSFPKFVLDEYFKGPGYTEYYDYGWRALFNGFTGYSKLEVRDGGAFVDIDPLDADPLEVSAPEAADAGPETAPAVRRATHAGFRDAFFTAP